MNRIISQIFNDDDINGLKELPMYDVFNKSTNKLFFSKYNILNKYPSHFFKEWVRIFGISNLFLSNLIKTIKNDNDPKWLNLLFNLLNNGLVTKISKLVTILLNHKLYTIASFVNIYNDEKQKSRMDKKIIVCKNNLFNKNDLRIHDINNLADDQIINYVAKTFSAEPNEQKNKLFSTKCLQNNKNLQKLLTEACQKHEGKLIKYLITEKDTLPSKNDLDNMLGLSMDIREKEKYLKYASIKNSEKKVLCINHKIYVKNYGNDIYDSLLFLHDKKFNFDILKRKQLLITKFCTRESLYIAIALSEIFKICKPEIFEKYALYELGKWDNVAIVKKMINLKLLRVEKLINSSFLSHALWNKSFEVAKYLIDDLKMKKIDTSIINMFKQNITAIKFLHDRNIPFPRACYFSLFAANDFVAINYCLNNLSFKVTALQLLSHVLFNRAFSNNNKKTLLFIKNCEQIKKIKNPERYLLYVLKWFKFNKNVELTTGVIKILTNGKNIKNGQELIKLAFKNSLYDIVVYLTDEYDIDLNIDSSDMTECFMEYYNKYNYYWAIDYIINLLKLAKKSSSAKEFNKFLKNVPGSFYNICLEKLFPAYIIYKRFTVDKMVQTDIDFTDKKVIDDIYKNMIEFQKLTKYNFSHDDYINLACSHYEQSGILFDVLNKLGKVDDLFIDKFIEKYYDINGLLKFIIRTDKTKLQKYISPRNFFMVVANGNPYLINEFIEAGVNVTPIFYTAIDYFEFHVAHDINKIISLLNNEQKTISKRVYNKLLSNRHVKKYMKLFDFNIVDDYEEKEYDDALRKQLGFGNFDYEENEYDAELLRQLGFGDFDEPPIDQAIYEVLGE